MDNTTRTVIATEIAAAIAAAASTPWTANVWEAGGHVRVYTRRRGTDQGYYSVDEDGDILIGSARNRTYEQSRAIEAIAAAHGVTVYR